VLIEVDMPRLTATNRHTLQWYETRVTYTPQTLGINYPWMNNHAGGSVTNYLTTQYNSTLVENDLALIASWGVTKIRAWGQLESVMDWSGSAYSLDTTYAANLDDFLTRCNNHNLQVILVIGDGHSSGGYASLDGKFQWTFVTGSNTAYLSALTTYVNHFKSHTNILMWEYQNEPYGNLTWSANAQASGATQAQTHTFLGAVYNTIKPLVGSTLVSFSDYEEDQTQTVYQLFSSATNRTNLIDDCTDVYNMHIYRKDQSQIADFRTLTSKPKWCTEVGSYNYYDPTASSHPIIAYNELDSGGPNGISGISNPYSVRSIAAELINAGFALVIPWSVGNNDSVVLHNPDGSHIVGSLGNWIKAQFNTTRLTANNRLTVT
jgi:hypothetical protein